MYVVITFFSSESRTGTGRRDTNSRKAKTYLNPMERVFPALTHLGSQPPQMGKPLPGRTAMYVVPLLMAMLVPIPHPIHLYYLWGS